MARTSAAEVAQIIDTDLSSTIIDAYIVAANALVSEVIGDDTSLSDTLKEEIERWLAAHLMASTRERQLTSGEAGGAKAVYQGKTGMRLESTLYGQQVLLLDASGSFASLGGKSATIIAVTSFD